MNHKTKGEVNMSLTGEDFHGSSESVSSSEPEAVGVVKVSQRSGLLSRRNHTVSFRKHYPMPLHSMICGTIILVFTAFVCFRMKVIISLLPNIVPGIYVTIKF